EDLGAAVQLLQYATNPNQQKSTKEKIFKFNDTQVKDIANKLATTFMQPTNTLEILAAMNRVMPDLEKIVPEKVPMIKQIQAETMKNMPPEFKRIEQQQKIWNQNSTP